MKPRMHLVILRQVVALPTDQLRRQRQRFQRVIFPDGLTFADGKVRNPKLSSVFSYLREIGGADERVASLTRFEPVCAQPMS